MRFEHRDGRIWFDLPAPGAAGSPLEVVVDYEGTPRPARRPPWDGGFTWASTPSGKPWIATTCQGEGADLWWPCKDHPSDKPETMDLRVTVARDLVCASNGTLASSDENPDGTRTWHWRIASPIRAHNVALNIAPYERIDAQFTSVGGEVVPVPFYVLPEHAARARKALPDFLGYMTFFEDVLGPYPFRNEKWGIAETPHLGMEHQTIIAYGNEFESGEYEGYDWLLHHETSHEWWGNLVTCRDWNDLWLHEGFGTYMQALWLERTFGADAYRREMAGNRRDMANAEPLAPREPMTMSAIYDNDVYNKGAWLLHTLRWLLGDERFFVVLRRMAYPTEALERVTDGSQVRFADTDEFARLAGEHAGQDLAWFFEVYARRASLPRLEARRQGNEVTLRWKVEGDLPFPLPVPVQVGDRIVRVEMPGGEGSVRVDEGQRYAIDPERRLLRDDR